MTVRLRLALSTLLLLSQYSIPTAATGAGAPSDTMDCVIQPSEVVDVGTAAPGLITAIRFDRSDTVIKGDRLVQLDASVEKMDVSLAAKQAQTETAIELRTAALSLGYKTIARNKSLQDKALISEKDMDKLYTDIKIAELNLELEQESKSIADIAHQRAQALLERKTIRSPISGVVVERYKSIGERVDDDAILRIAQLDPLHIEVIVPVKYFNTIDNTLQALVTPKLSGATSHVAQVQRIDKLIDAASGTFGVRLSLPNPGNTIPAGILCQLEFVD